MTTAVLPPMPTQRLKIGRWTIDILHGGYFWIDGGAMYGVVPRTVWQQFAPPDAQNRTLVSTHCLVARDGASTVLVDTGYGGKYSPLDRKAQGLEAGEPIVESLARLGISPNDVTHVVMSHMHFDHAGGATRRDGSGKLVPVFSGAQHLVQRQEWLDASSGADEFSAAYNLDNVRPLAEAGLVAVIEGDVELLPGLRTRLTGGHTAGHQAIEFAGSSESLLFIGDICPTVAHMKPLWATSYETYLLETRRVKPKILGECAERGTWIVWNHDPNTPVGRIQPHKRGFMLSETLK